MPEGQRWPNRLEPQRSADRWLDPAAVLSYRITNNNNRKNNSTRPTYAMKRDGSMIVTHTEFCGLVNTQTVQPEGYDLDGKYHEHRPMKLPINPGDGRLFPWLTAVASRFEKYRFTNLTLHYKPTCSTFISGGVALVPIYDPSEPVPVDRHILYNAEGVVRGPLYRGVSLNIPRSRMRPTDTMFVRETHDELMDANELRMTDLGYFVVSVSDSHDNVNFGDLFVTYTVELTSPRVGRRSGKCARHTWKGTFVSGASTHVPPLGPEPKMHGSGTLMVAQTLENGTVAGKEGYINSFQFAEPFTGQLAIHRKAGNVADVQSQLIVNGRTSSGGEVAVVNPGAKDKSRKAKHKWLHTIKDGFKEFVDIIEVVADSGDLLELAQDAVAAVHSIADATMTWSDLAPELIEASLLV